MATYKGTFGQLGAARKTTTSPDGIKTTDNSVKAQITTPGMIATVAGDKSTTESFDGKKTSTKAEVGVETNAVKATTALRSSEGDGTTPQKTQALDANLRVTPSKEISLGLEGSASKSNNATVFSGKAQMAYASPVNGTGGNLQVACSSNQGCATSAQVTYDKNNIGAHLSGSIRQEIARPTTATAEMGVRYKVGQAAIGAGLKTAGDVKRPQAFIGLQMPI